MTTTAESTQAELTQMQSGQKCEWMQTRRVDRNAE